MRLAINTRFLIKDKLEGFGWFTYEHCKRIVRAHPEHEFVFLFDRPFDPSFIFSDNVTGVVVGPPARHPILWYWWFEFSLPKVLKRLNIDLFISTDGFLSLKTTIPTLLVIHDVAFEHYPEFIPKLVAKYYRYFTPRYARKAKHIVTVSDYSKETLVNLYSVPTSNVTVVHNGAANSFKPIDSDDRLSIQQTYSEGKPYLLFVGALHPRKNITRLLAAFDAFKTESGSNFKLVIAGREMFGNEEMKQTWKTMKHKDEVVFTGHLSMDELARVNAAAFALVYVSIFEGFGIPIVEAMKCGIPVIASNASAIPEVAGDAAIYVDPFSIQEITQAMIKLSNDQSSHQNLSEKALIQSKTFSWDRAAESFWKVIENQLMS